MSDETPGAEPSWPSVPRSREDDLDPAVVDARRALLRRASGRPLEHLFGAPVDPRSSRGNVENFVGYAQVPVGVAGPLVVDTSAGTHRAYVPFATTEGAMVAAYGRGMRLLAAGGGARARVLGRGLTQVPILVYRDVARAQAAAAWCAEHEEPLRALVAGITRHGALVGVAPEVLGRRLVLRLEFTTGDAIGINMAAHGAELVCRRVAEATDAQRRYVHGQDVEKRANARATIEGRGRRVVCDVTVPRAELARIARTTPEDLVELWQSYRVGFAQLGTQNWLVQSANGLAAVFLACGQDVAYVTESATGQLDLARTHEGDLYASAWLPSLLVGTVGGGSGQGTARECLELLGCAGPGRVDMFAELLAATVLAGDLSLLAAFATHDFVEAHERLGRNRPPAAPSAADGPA